MKVPKARKLSSGTWFIQLRLNGESIPVTADTAAKCEAEAAAIKSGLKNNTRNNAVPTLRDAIDTYIQIRSDTLSPATIAGYRNIQRNHFQSVMDERIDNITGWQRLCNLEAKRYSPKTLKNSFRFITSVLSENGIRVDRVSLPTAQPAMREWLEPDQIKTLVKSVTGTPNALYVFFALHSLRRSEIVAMRWENIDLDKKQFTVKGAIVYNESGSPVYKKSNKVAASTRTIPIMIPEMLDALKQQEKKSGFVFSCSPKAVHERINRACRDAGVPQVGTHGLRHSFASLAYHLGMSELETMEIGGWADQNTMRKIYTHLAASDRRKAGNKLCAFFSETAQNAN